MPPGVVAPVGGSALRGWRTAYLTFGIRVEKALRETLSARGAHSEEG